MGLLAIYGSCGLSDVLGGCPRCQGVWMLHRRGERVVFGGQREEFEGKVGVWLDLADYGDSTKHKRNMYKQTVTNRISDNEQI